ncbi:uncharacterized protein CTHT_0064720 [Thermochaetoides thermophila DSM 1495]|uniref:Phosphatidate cytidylyltransferase n=1 Tax=Chaetomium thermophilum (strain DSM 1495 / CBS 144.50 / IMI 039719) TaxID=759272 RepID=G0SG19_CHATD|nr:hypothetical protein CTHT_0064720 [Thermochaetoides thermophila DSM 1495]EGS17158.1 hypothetical protein CTHT_0064720 [Thermochaetoides thermophila DSM 1495]
MTGRLRRGVKFPYKHNGQSEARRGSFSEASEEGSSRADAIESLDELSKPAKVEDPKTEYEKKKANFITRTFWTFIMIGGFFAALFMGHVYVLAIITAVQIVSFKEVISISNLSSKARDLRSTKSLNWYWLATTMYFLYGESVIYYLKHIVLPYSTDSPGFVFFVGSLKAGHLKFQFSQFAWTHMALFLIVVQAHFIMNNVLEGLIWFFLPAALVITNDIFAYICGITFGRTQLIKLSPKKTVEGFVGAWIMTILFGIVLTNLLLRSKYFICPATNLGANIFTGLECEPNPVFIPRTYTTPELFFLPPNYSISVTIAPMQFHAFFWASFASLIAPFGGFFASGLKRTFKIKDFGDSIPGHGGMTDRMDCQFIMGLFAYIYYHTFIAFKRSSVSHVMELAIMELTADEQMEVIKGVLKYLSNQGIVKSDTPAAFEKLLSSAKQL